MFLNFLLVFTLFVNVNTIFTITNICILNSGILESSFEFYIFDSYMGFVVRTWFSIHLIRVRYLPRLAVVISSSSDVIFLLKII